MPPIIVCVLARNEAGRDLPDMLANAATYADQILLLDDRSTDGTADLARKHGAEVRRRSALPAWGNESPARRELWEWGCEVVRDGWLLVQDADMLLVGDPKPLTETWTCNTWCWTLYDLWNETEARADEFWRGHEFARPWMACPSRVPEGWTPEWPNRGIHVGHLPMNWPMATGVVGPEILHWRHLAYVTPARRKAKYEQYRQQFHQMTEAERAHATSICALD